MGLFLVIIVILIVTGILILRYAVQERITTPQLMGWTLVLTALGLGFIAALDYLFALTISPSRRRYAPH